MTIGERTQVGRNTLASFSFFVANAVFALWLVPFLIGKLGIDGYGLVVLGLSVTAYVSLVAGSVNSSISRFLTLDIVRRKFSCANETFNTAFFGGLGGVLLLLPLLWYFAEHVSTFVNVPDRYANSASSFVLLIAGAFVITFLRNILTVPAFAQNRLDLIFLCQAVELGAKLLVLVLLMNLLAPDVHLVGYAILAGSVAAGAASIVTWRMLAPYLTLSPSWVRSSRLSELFTMSAWVTVNSTGALLFLNVDLITANLIVGIVAAGQFGAILQIAVALRSAATLLVRIVAPLFFSRFAKGDMDGLEVLALRSMKLVGILVACPVGLVCAWSSEFLSLWLGPEFASLEWLVWLCTMHLAVNLACRPLFFIQQAANRVRVPAIVTLALGIAHIGLSILLAWGLGWGVYGIAASGALMLTSKNCVFTVVYGASILERPPGRFLQPVVVAAASTALALVIGELVGIALDIRSWLLLVTSTLASVLVYFTIVWFVLLRNEDRSFVQANLPGLASLREPR